MKNKYSLFSLDTLMFFLISSITSSSWYYIFITENKIDTIFVIIIGSVIGIIPIFIYNQIMDFNKENNLIDNLNSLFKTPIILKIVLVLVSFIMMIIALQEIASFINIYLLKNSNTLIIGGIFLLLGIYTVSKGFNTIVKASIICFYLFVFISILSFVGTINLVDLGNLKPLFISDEKSLILNSVIYSFLSTAPLFMLSIIRKKDIEKEKYLNSNFYKTYISASIFATIEFIFTLGILGISLLSIYKYPAINIYKKISFLDIFERVESFFAVKFLFYSFFLIVVSLYFSFTICKSFFPKKKKDNILLGIIFLVTVFISYFYKFNSNIYLISFYILGIIIPTIVYLKMLLYNNKLLRTKIS